MNELIRVPDGGRFVLRPMEVRDAGTVRDGFAGMSPSTLRLRFFSPGARLTAGVVADLTAVDPGRRIVLLAFEAGTGRFVGEARAVRHANELASADIAVTVADAFQRRGLGLALLLALRRAARAVGVERLTGHVLVENPAGRALLRAAGARTAFDEPGVLRFELPIAPITVAAA